ncbi:MAG: LysM peptidoglycan-binding domain-containing protein [Desulfamplus sp.]|nr:LysM peptidoglycan-binding domain-containing protein [Desulfamplus sp.]
MKNLLYASILAISLFLSACTMNSGQKLTSLETIDKRSDNTSPNISNPQNTSGACTLQKDSLKDRHESFIFELFKNQTKDSQAISYNQKEAKIDSEGIISSKEINHALDLCVLAQSSWEQGDTDKALANLDLAYASILNLEVKDTKVNKQKEDLRFMISKRIMEIYTSRQTAVKGEHNEIPLTINKYVQKEIDRLTGAEKDFFIRSMARAAEYRPFIVKKLKEAGLPEELSWLPLIESGFRVQALSPARALGLWQFIPSTGHKFGLKRDYYVDERMDPFKSTEAAIKYLSELHTMFGDWSTVLAAYNCGEGRVLRTIRSQNVNYLDNFWDLYEKLPQETASYVPKFIATLNIINNLEKYGMPQQKKIAPIEYQTITVNKQLKLTDIARKMVISRTVLETLNPELKYGVLPPEEYQLRIPANTMDSSFLAAIDDIRPSEPVSPKSYSSHKVKRGETLFSVAKKYGITMGDLAAANNISTKYSISAGKVIKIPEDTASTQYRTSKEAKKSQEASGSKKVASNNSVKYKVKQGDTMWSIAKRHNTTPDAIKAANSLSDYTVNEGKEITIPKTKSLEQKTGVNPKKSTHWVKSGDTPFTIAQKYNMSVQRLFDLNRLSKSSKIFPGQKLLVE